MQESLQKIKYEPFGVNVPIKNMLRDAQRAEGSYQYNGVGSNYVKSSIENSGVSVRDQIKNQLDKYTKKINDMTDAASKHSINDVYKKERYIAATGTGLIGAGAIGGTGYLAKKGYDKFRGQKK